MNDPRPYGWLARFPDADGLLAAVGELRAFGYTRLEAYTPYAVEGLSEALGSGRSWVAPAVLVGGLAGGGGTLFMEWYSAVVAYPIDVGGRPLASWPAFLPAALEMTLLGAFLAGFLALMLGTGLPRLHHPLFAARHFEDASQDGFFLLLRADDPGWDAQRAEADLARLAPISMQRVDA